MDIIEQVRTKLIELEIQGIKPNAVYLGGRTFCHMKAQFDFCYHQDPTKQKNELFKLPIIEVCEPDHMGIGI